VELIVYPIQSKILVRMEDKEVFGAVKVGEHGQITIPKELRVELSIKPKDTVWLMKIDNYLVMQAHREKVVDRFVETLGKLQGEVTYEDIKKERIEEDKRYDKKMEAW